MALFAYETLKIKVTSKSVDGSDKVNLPLYSINRNLCSSLLSRLVAKSLSMNPILRFRKIVFFLVPTTSSIRAIKPEKYFKKT